MKYFKNFLLITLLLCTMNIIHARVGKSSTQQVTQPIVQPRPAPALATPKPTPIPSSSVPPSREATKGLRKTSMAAPKTYAEALNYIKSNMQAGDVLIGNTFTQKFINFVKELDLYFVETEALLQAGVSLYATWTGNDKDDSRSLYSLKNTIESITQAQITMPSQPAQPSSPKPVPQPNIAPPVERKLPIIPKNKAPEDIFHKVKKLEVYDDIFVGAGTSDTGEPIYFALEKLNPERTKVWKKYIWLIWTDYHRKVIKKLEPLLKNCDNADYQKQQDQYTQKLMTDMCLNKEKLSTLFSEATGIGIGPVGFDEMLGRYSRQEETIYVAYASSQPITGPFKPKKELNIESYTLEDFETAYSDIIICVCVDMLQKLNIPISTEHRGIFKNIFAEIRGTYKNIGLKLHGWAGAVEKQFFNKKYATLFPTKHAGNLLHRAVPKGGGLYLGVNTKPFKYERYYGTAQEQQTIKEKFPPIKQELIGDTPITSRFGTMEDLHVFDLNALSKYYTEQ
jgi:hypothetical protein